MIPRTQDFEPDGKKKIVVTGCGRSGTLYMTKVLEILGYEVGHEGFKKDGICSWYITEKSRAILTKRIVEGQDVTYVHLVRHPLKVISSMMRCELITKRAGLDFFRRTNPEFNHLSIVEHCARYWFEWNIAVQKRFPINITIRVEDITNGHHLLAGFLSMLKGPGLDLESYEKIIGLGEKCHTYDQETIDQMVAKHGEESLRTISLDELGSIGSRVHWLGLEYGYEF